MAGDIAAIGLLWPSDGRNDREFWRWLPNDISLLVSRYTVGGTLDLEQLERDGDMEVLTKAACMLQQAGPDVIGLGDCAAGFVEGAAAELAKTRAIEDATGIPVVSMSISLAKALLHLGAEQVAVVSPYGADVSEKLDFFLSGYGLDVVVCHALSCDDESSINAMTGADWLRAARHADRTSAQAVLVAGGGVSLFPIVEEMEALLDKPVVCGPGALIWAALAHIGVAGSRTGCGTLFRERATIDHHQAPCAPNSYLSCATKTYAVSASPPVISSGAGSWLLDSEGRRYLDFACGSGTTNLGHNHPAVMDAVDTQLNSGLAHVGPHFLSEEQVRLYQLLRSVLPEHLTRFHPATNGTEATETALKAAMHFTGKRRFLAFKGSYHGRTIGALAVSDSKGRNRALGPLLPETIFAPYGCPQDRLEHIIDSAQPLAGIVVEPVQATQGMIFPAKGWLRMLASLAEAREIPLISDEVFTGFGRTGHLFSFMGEDFVPDLLVLGKAFGGGFPAGLVAGRDDIMTTWLPGTQSSTFQLHPVSAVAARASLEFILTNDVPEMASRIARWISVHSAMLIDFGFVADIRGRGAMFGVEIANDSGAPDHDRTRAIRADALQNGLITWECGSSGHVIGIVPPLTTSEREIAHGFDLLRKSFVRIQ